MTNSELISEQRAVNQRYIAGEIERPEYHALIAGIHAQMSENSKRGKCVCMACREHRGEQ